MLSNGSCTFCCLSAGLCELGAVAEHVDRGLRGCPRVGEDTVDDRSPSPDWTEDGIVVAVLGDGNVAGVVLLILKRDWKTGESALTHPPESNPTSSKPRELLCVYCAPGIFDSTHSSGHTHPGLETLEEVRMKILSSAIVACSACSFTQ